MNRRFLRLLLAVAGLLAFPWVAPAPLIYTPGEGWVYESYGAAGKWRRDRAKDQLEVAQKAFDEKDYDTALRAARRTVNNWEHSDYAPKAQYLIGRCYEAKGNDEKAFKEYQQALKNYPKVEDYADVLQRQYEIASRFLGGQRFRAFGVIPLFSSMERTVDMYEKLIDNGPHSSVAPQAQIDIGTAHEKTKDYPRAVKAYERAADRYHDKPVAPDAVFKAGGANLKQAKTAEYDQSAAGRAIASYGDFIALYPGDTRVPEAEKNIGTLKAEQARGSFQIAKFYEKRRKWDGAVIYYNEVLLKDPDSPMADEAKSRIESIKLRQGAAPSAPMPEKPAEKK